MSRGGEIHPRKKLAVLIGLIVFGWLLVYGIYLMAMVAPGATLALFVFAVLLTVWTWTND